MLRLLWLILLNLQISNSFDQATVHPQSLDFGPCQIGYVSTRNVTISNVGSTTVIVSSVYDSRSAFQGGVARSETTSVKSGQQTQFAIMFLPQALGEVSETVQLFVYLTTSSTPIGLFDIAAKGFGSENPYRLYPFVGVRWPTSVAYSPTVHIYNPHETELEVEEIYASGGNLNLVPPFNEVQSWKIPPYETKSIVRLNLFSEKSYNHLSYVTVRLAGNRPNIKLPVDVDLVSTAEVFPMPQSINFGSLARDSPPKVVTNLFYLG